MNCSIIKRGVVAVIIPALFFAITIWDISGLMETQKTSSAGLLFTILDVENPFFCGRTIYQLFYVPSFVILFSGDESINKTWEMVRYHNRNSFFRNVISSSVYYCVEYVLLLGILKFLLLFYFVPFSAWPGKLTGYCIFDLFFAGLYFFRSLILYLIALFLTRSKGLGILSVVAIYLIEFIFYNYVIYRAVISPCHTLSLPFLLLKGELNGMLLILAGVSSFVLTIALVLLSFVLINKRDMVRNG